MKRSVFPFRQTGSRILDLKPFKLEDKRSEVQVSKFGWLTDGKVLPIEEGLPVYSLPPPPSDLQKRNPMYSLIHLIEDKPYLKKFQKDYGELASRHPEYDLSDPDMMSHYEKQLITDYYTKLQEQQAKMHEDVDEIGKSPKNLLEDLKIRVTDDNGNSVVTSKIPADAHLYTWGNALPYFDGGLFNVEDPSVAKKKPVKEKLRTGIHGPQDLHAQDESAIIREVNFRTLKKKPENLALAKDSPYRPLRFRSPALRANSTIASMPSRKPNSTVKQYIKKYFDPEVGIPFVPADVGQYFPVDLLIPEEIPIQNLSQNYIESSRAFLQTQGISLDPDPEEECDPKSTLLDTTDEDVLFTAGKAPFTRSEIARIREFGNHWDDLKIKQKQKAQSALAKRESMIKQTFQSKEIFEKYLHLLDEDCKRIQSGVLGKSQYKHKSLWEVAVETAKLDHSGLKERREFWWRFCAFVRFNGGIKEHYEKEFVKTLRIQLMVQHPVKKSLFWDVINEIDPVSFESVATLKLIEFCRLFLSVSQPEFGAFLDNHKISPMIYNQACINNASRDYADKTNSIAFGPIEVPPID